MTHTLSLADIARLSGVQRPVVTMWRKRLLDGVPFPAAAADGRYPAAEVLDYLERTQRGNNPHVRRDLAIHLARADREQAPIEHLLALLAAKAVTGLDLAETDPEDLLDAIDELDPDDDWLFSELEAVEIDRLAGEADALADAAWSVPDAYETLLATLRARASTGVEPGQDLTNLMGSLARLLRSHRGALVDAAGTAADVIIALTSHDEALDAPVVLPAAGEGVREARRRYAVHGITPRRPTLDADWDLPDGSVILVTLPPDTNEALDLLDEVALQLAGASTALVVGPASVLVDQLPSAEEARRDRFLRDPNRTLAVVLRLPQGLTRSGGREHLALWLLQPGAPDSTRIGDLAGVRPSPTMWQQLLDDLLAVASGVRTRAFALLQRVPATTLLAAGGSLVDHDVAVVAELPPAAGDDAARMQQLLDAITAPIDNPFEGWTPWVRGSVPARHVTLGEASRSRHVRVLPGTRVESLPEGATPLWTPGSLTSGTPRAIDLLAFSAAHPRASLTEPGDVVFTTDGRPAAVVDAIGGAVVAYPARVIRVAPGQPFSPRAIVSTVNAVQAGNSKWRSWQIPVAHGDPAHADGVLARVDELATLLRDRQTQVDELRRLVVRAVLPGSVTFRDTRTDDAKGD